MSKAFNSEPSRLSSSVYLLPPKYPHITTVGGYNLEAAVPITNLVTIDPVLHAVGGLSGLIKTTDGPLGNVQTFTNYYETKGGTATAELYSSKNGGVDLGPDQNFRLGNFFSAGITGSFLNSKAQNGTAGETNITTQQPNLTVITSYQNDGAEVIYGKLKGSQVQHDAIPFFVQQTVIDLLNNS